MSNPIHILLIDDDSVYSEVFKKLARTYNMQVKAFTTGEQGFQELKNNLYLYSAIVLDARCIWSSSGAIPSDKFLSNALLALERLERERNLYFPTVVNTAYKEDFSEDTQFVEKRGGKIFTKAAPNGKVGDVFEFLKEKIEHTEEWIYRDAFEAIDLIEDSTTDCRAKLKSILKDFHNPAKNESVLQDARVIQEEIYRVLTNLSIFPSHVNSFMKKNKHLSGNEDRSTHSPTSTVYQTPALSILASTVYMVSSSFGNHAASRPTNRVVKYWETPSNYAVKSVVYALLEQLIWFKKLTESLP